MKESGMRARREWRNWGIWFRVACKMTFLNKVEADVADDERYPNEMLSGWQSARKLRAEVGEPRESERAVGGERWKGKIWRVSLRTSFERARERAGRLGPKSGSFVQARSNGTVEKALTCPCECTKRAFCAKYRAFHSRPQNRLSSKCQWREKPPKGLPHPSSSHSFTDLSATCNENIKRNIFSPTDDDYTYIHTHARAHAYFSVSNYFAHVVNS